MSQTKAQLIAPVGIVTTKGVVVTGVMTATSFTGDVVGSATSIISGSNLNLGTVTATASIGFGGDFTGTATGIQTGAAIKVGVFTATSFTGDFTGTATSMMRGTGFEAGTVTSTAANVTYTITVGSKTGGGNAFYIDGVEAPVITLYPGATYTFDQAAGTNDTHPLRLATAADAAGSTEYTDGVTTNGTPGTAGAYTRIVVPRTAPTPLYYYCSNHGGMGNSINITNQLQGNVTGNVTGSITGLAGSVTSGGNIHIGVITATSYSGDGSNLTGIAATNFNTQTVTANAAETIIDLSDGNMITMNQSADTTVGFASTSTAMEVTIIRIKDANTTARTITWPSSIKWTGGSAPTLISNSVSGDSQQFTLLTRDSGVTWYGWQAYEFDGPYRDKYMYMTGRNAYGQLGLNETGATGNNTSRSSPTQLGSDTWSTAANNWGNGSTENSGAIDMEGKLWTWGNNPTGNLGHNNRTTCSSPTQVGAGTDWSSVAMDELHTLAIKTDGSLWSWGNSGQGQVGNNDKTTRSSPVQVGTDTTWSKVQTVGNGSYALKTNGTLWSWGANDNGQLGHSNNTDYSSPKQVGTNTTWSDVAGWYQCVGALKTNGTLWAWGDNQNEGQLGQNNKTDYSSPKQVGTETTWASIGSGYNSNGIKTDGTLWLWGRNQYGGLGDNQSGPWPSYNYAASSPRQVSGTTWAAGTYTGCWAVSYVKKTDGTWWAWGLNQQGALGDNTTVHRSSPVQIPGTFSAVRGRGSVFAHWFKDA